MTEHDTGTEPISSTQIPCVDHEGKPPWMRSSGRTGRLPTVCSGCRLEVSRAEPPEIDRPNYRAWRAVPHVREQHVHALADVASCSCGGWQGTPVGHHRVDDGSELLLLSFQGKVDDIEHNVENLVDLVLAMKDQLDRLAPPEQP